MCKEIDSRVPVVRADLMVQDATLVKPKAEPKAEAGWFESVQGKDSANDGGYCLLQSPRRGEGGPMKAQDSKAYQ